MDTDMDTDTDTYTDTNTKQANTRNFATQLDDYVMGEFWFIPWK